MKDKTKSQQAVVENRDRNPDPITDAPGAHPVGVGLGAAAGGAATGAIAGAVAGPVGAAVGAVAGAVIGGYAGKAAAEAVDPTVEEAYWRENYRTRPYNGATTDYDQIGPAYRYGWESRQRHPDLSFEDAETDLQQGWSKAPSSKSLSWDKAKHATRDAWNRVERALPGDADNDGR